MFSWPCLIFGVTGEASWERTSTCRSYGGRSSQTWWDFCSVCGAGSTVSCPPFTGLQDPLDPIKPADWDTRPNRVSDVNWPWCLIVYWLCMIFLMSSMSHKALLRHFCCLERERGWGLNELTTLFSITHNAFTIPLFLIPLLKTSGKYSMCLWIWFNIDSKSNV